MSPARPLAALAACAAIAVPTALAATGDIGPSLGIVNSGRHLHPYGTQTQVGSVPMGGALTPDGRFYWTVSAGAGANDVQIVSVKSKKVVQVLPLPGASGGIAIDPKGGKAYVSGLKNSTNKGTTQPTLPGGTGQVMHVFTYSKASGKATEKGLIQLKTNQTDKVEDFPLGATPTAYPEHPGISPDGKTLVVPLGLTAEAAIVNTKSGAATNVAVGRYPYGAAVTPNGKDALVTNEATGTTSVIDLKRKKVIKTITTGGHLAHPEGVVAPAGNRAYVAIANQDKVGVIDTKRWRLIKTLSVANKAGIGASPIAVAVGGGRLFAADTGIDAVSVFKLGSLKSLGRVPTAHLPTDVETVGGRTLIWLSGKALGTGPNPKGPDPFHSQTLDQTGVQSQFLPRITLGSTGIGSMPSDAKLRSLTKVADKQVIPENLPAAAPSGTPIKPGGPIKHVFFIVRENRTYDQLLGDAGQGASDPSLELFGPNVTPNIHALTQRFPLLDHLFANSEASIQGHQWTSAGMLSNYSEENWNQISNPFAKYGDRGRPFDEGMFAVSFPPKGYLFDQAARQNISYANYGEAMAGTIPLPYPQLAILANAKDADISSSEEAAVQDKFNHSDLGPTINNGCYPNVFYLGTDVLTGKQTYDSSLPPGASSGAESRFDCFKQKFDAQLAAGTVPAFNYLSMPGDHTQGLSPGELTPNAYVADNDYGTAQVIDLVSHSSIWSSSAIFVIEDDSQDGADHVDAHRIPAIVASPYAKTGVVSTRYDQLSVLRTMELILGMNPLSLNDALATPMYDAFQATPANSAPYNAIDPVQSRTETNPGTKGRGVSIPLDSITQRALDAQLWRSVHGRRSTPPPPGPGAVAEPAGGDG